MDATKHYRNKKPKLYCQKLYESAEPSLTV